MLRADQALELVRLGRPLVRFHRAHRRDGRAPTLALAVDRVDRIADEGADRLAEAGGLSIEPRSLPGLEEELKAFGLHASV